MILCRITRLKPQSALPHMNRRERDTPARSGSFETPSPAIQQRHGIMGFHFLRRIPKSRFSRQKTRLLSQAGACSETLFEAASKIKSVKVRHTDCAERDRFRPNKIAKIFAKVAFKTSETRPQKPHNSLIIKWCARQDSNLNRVAPTRT